MTQDDSMYPPIPVIKEDWSLLPELRFSKEPLVQIVDTAKLISRSIYAEQNLPHATPELYVRETVYMLLLQASQNLPEGISLCVRDAYRPLALQQILWDQVADDFRARHPDWTQEQINEATGEFVAQPILRKDRPAPHSTGGAVDVKLLDSHGNPIPMGTSLDSVSLESYTAHFEIHPDEPFRHNRRVLYHAMTQSGFVNYPNEWWHFEYGTIRWAKQNSITTAIYGGIEASES